jgi:hypothetical protein
MRVRRPGATNAAAAVIVVVTVGYGLWLTAVITGQG